jgi:hypothetical protein
MRADMGPVQSVRTLIGLGIAGMRVGCKHAAEICICSHSGTRCAALSTDCSSPCRMDLHEHGFPAPGGHDIACKLEAVSCHGRSRMVRCGGCKGTSAGKAGRTGAQLCSRCLNSCQPVAGERCARGAAQEPSVPCALCACSGARAWAAVHVHGVQGAKGPLWPWQV